MSDDQHFWNIYNQILNCSIEAYLGFDELNNFAEACEIRKLYDTAEKYYLKAIQYQKNRLPLNYSDVITIPMLHLATMNHCMQNFVAAEKYYLITINECDHAKNIDFDKYKSIFTKMYGWYSTNKKIALNQLAKMYERQNKYNIAIKYYILAIDNGDKYAKNDLDKLRIKIMKITMLIIHRKNNNLIHKIPKYILIHILKFI